MDLNFFVKVKRRRLLVSGKDNLNNEINKKMIRAAKILERMVNQNTYDDIAQGTISLQCSRKADDIKLLE